MRRRARSQTISLSFLVCEVVRVVTIVIGDIDAWPSWDDCVSACLCLCACLCRVFTRDGVDLCLETDSQAVFTLVCQNTYLRL